MLNIIGIGATYPETVIHNEELLKIQGSIAHAPAQGSAFKTRRSSLPLSYLRETKNADTWKAPLAALISPTQLGVQAIKEALYSSSTALEDLRLIIGDCSTPLETTPGESQRVAASLGLKSRAFDVCACSCSLTAHLDALSKWQEELIPDITISLSTNVPTQNIDYSQGAEAFLFGDAASALAISTQRKGKLRVCDTFLSSDNAQLNFLKVHVYEPMELGELPSRTWIKERVGSVIERLKASNDLSGLKVILPPLFADDCKEEISALGLLAVDYWGNAEFFGDSLGSYSGCVLAEHWSEINSESRILILQVGPGASFGSVFLKGQEE